MSFGMIILLLLMITFIGIVLMKKEKIIGLSMAVMLVLSVMLSYVTMGIGQYKNSLEVLLDSGLTYDVVYYEFPSKGPVIFLLKAEGHKYPKYYLIEMSNEDKKKTKDKLKKLEQKKLKLGHGTIQMGGGTQDEDYGFSLDPNEHRPELKDKVE